MVGVHEHIGAHGVIVPHEAMFEVVLDSTSVDVGKVSLTDIAVESPDSHIDAEDHGARLKSPFVGVIVYIERVGRFWSG